MTARRGNRDRESQSNRPRSLASPLDHPSECIGRGVRWFGDRNGRYFAAKSDAALLFAHHVLQYSMQPGEQLIERPLRRCARWRFFAEVICDRWLRLPIFERAPQRFLRRAFRIARAEACGSGCQRGSQAAGNRPLDRARPEVQPGGSCCCLIIILPSTAACRNPAASPRGTQCSEAYFGLFICGLVTEADLA